MIIFSTTLPEVVTSHTNSFWHKKSRRLEELNGSVSQAASGEAEGWPTFRVKTSTKPLSYSCTFYLWCKPAFTLLCFYFIEGLLLCSFYWLLYFCHLQGRFLYFVVLCVLCFLLSIGFSQQSPLSIKCLIHVGFASHFQGGTQITVIRITLPTLLQSATMCRSIDSF